MSMTVNILLCITAPLVVMLLLIPRRSSAKQVLLFFLIGMAVCFAAGYVHTFVLWLLNLTPLQAALYEAPIVEEILKAVPIIIFFILTRPDFKSLFSAAIATGAGFATLESILYLTQGLADPATIILRGVSTGVMHAMTVSLFAVFLWYVIRNGVARSWFTFLTCGIGVLASGITIHGCYNMLINTQGAAQIVGYLIPIIIAVIYGVCIIIYEKRKKRTKAIPAEETEKPAEEPEEVQPQQTADKNDCLAMLSETIITIPPLFNAAKVNKKNGNHRWCEMFLRYDKNVFRLQDEIYRRTGSYFTGEEIKDSFKEWFESLEG